MVKGFNWIVDKQSASIMANFYSQPQAAKEAYKDGLDSANNLTNYSDSFKKTRNWIRYFSYRAGLEKGCQNLDKEEEEEEEEKQKSASTL